MAEPEPATPDRCDRAEGGSSRRPRHSSSPLRAKARQAQRTGGAIPLLWRVRIPQLGGRPTDHSAMEAEEPRARALVERAGRTSRGLARQVENPAKLTMTFVSFPSV